jgi:hypothetical protein
MLDRVIEEILAQEFPQHDRADLTASCIPVNLMIDDLLVPNACCCKRLLIWRGLYHSLYLLPRACIDLHDTFIVASINRIFWKIRLRNPRHINSRDDDGSRDGENVCRSGRNHRRPLRYR